MHIASVMEPQTIFQDDAIALKQRVLADLMDVRLVGRLYEQENCGPSKLQAAHIVDSFIVHNCLLIIKY